MKTSRRHIGELLAASPGYRALPGDRRRQIARDTVRVATYLVDPDGLISSEFRQPLLAGVVTAGIAPSWFPGRGIVVNPGSFDALVAAVDFPGFVAGLIEGVFSAILTMSIEQMQAFAELIKAVAATVDEFARDHVDERAARASLIDEFPAVFCGSGGQRPRLRFHPGATALELSRLASAIGLRETPVAAQDAAEVVRIVAAARRRIARNRQQLLATALMMGINRCLLGEGGAST